MVDALISEVEVDLGLLKRNDDAAAAAVVLLQAGPISRRDCEGGNGDGEAHEKLTRHWEQLGFQAWSDSDDAWLCLGEKDRVWLEDVVPHLL